MELSSFKKHKRNLFSHYKWQTSLNHISYLRSTTTLTRFLISGLLGAGAGVLLSTQAKADDIYWDGAGPPGNGTVNGGAGTWDGSATNWTGQNGNATLSWSNLVSDTAVFKGQGGAVNVSGGLTVGGLTFETNGYKLQSAGGTNDHLTLSAFGDHGTIDVQTSNVTAEINTTIASGALGAGLTKIGNGTLILSGANTYTGGTTINAGTIQLQGAGTLGDVTKSTSVKETGTLDLGGTTTAVQKDLALGGKGTLTNGTIKTTTYSLSGESTQTGTAIVNTVDASISDTTTMGGTLNATGSVTHSGGKITGTVTTSDYKLSQWGVVALGGTVTTSIATITGGSIETGGTLIATGTVTQTGGKITGTVTASDYQLSQQGLLASGGTVNIVTATIKGGIVERGANITATTGITQTGGDMGGTITNTPTYNLSDGTMYGEVVNGTDFNQDGGTMSGTVTSAKYTFSDGTITGKINATDTLTQNGGTIESRLVYGKHYDLQAGTLTGTVLGETATIKGSVAEDGQVRMTGKITQLSGSDVGGTVTAPLYELNGGTMHGEIVNGTDVNQLGGTMSGTTTTKNYALSDGSVTGKINATVKLSQTGGTLGGQDIYATDYELSGGHLKGKVEGVNATITNTGEVDQNGVIKVTSNVAQSGGVMGGSAEANHYEQSGGSMSGQVNVDSYLLTNGRLENASGVTANAFGQTGGEVWGNVNAKINARAIGGTISTLSSAGINVSNATGKGVFIWTNQDGVVSNANGTAITARETTGEVDINTKAGVVGAVGIDAVTEGTGNVRIITDAKVGGIAGAAISAGSADGSITISSQEAVQGGTQGIAASSQKGRIDITTGKSVSGANGIVAVTAGTGGVNIASNGTVLGTSGAAISAATSIGNLSVVTRDVVQGGAYGVLASSLDGQVNVRTGAVISGATGVSANATGTGNVDVTTVDDVVGTSGAAVTASSKSGRVTVTALDVVQGGSYGIQASSETGEVAVQSGAGVSGDTGIDATTAGVANVSVAANGAVQAKSGAAISAGSVGGNVMITGTGAIKGGSYGVFVKSQIGNVSVKTGNTISGNTAIALETTGNGAMDLDLGGAVTANDTAISFKGETTNSHAVLDQSITAGLTALRSNTTGVVTFDNYSTIRYGGDNASAAGNASSLTLLDNVAGQAILNNYSGGQIQGMLASGAGAQTLVSNMAGGVWDMGNSGASNLLGSNDVIQNYGLIKATGNTQLNGLERFENNAGGQLSLVNGAVGDKLTISGDYVGHAGSNIALDVNFDNSTADVVTVGGVLMGTTNLKLNALTAGQAPTAFGKTILILDAAKGGDGTVTVEGLPSGGIVQYDVARIGGSGSDPSRFVIRSGINGTAASSVVSGFIAAQNVIGSSFFKPSSGLISAPVDPDKNQFGLAPWIRTNGGMSKIDTKGTIYQPDGSSVDAPATIETSYYGYQVGLDAGLFNIQDTGGNVNFGLTGGQIFGKSDQKNFANTTDFNSVFYGAYAAYTKGPFFIDLQVRRELMDYTVNVDDPIFKINGGDVDGERLSIGGSTSYTIPYKDWSFIPATGFTYSKSSTDDLLVPHNILFNQNEARVRFSDVESLIGFGGLTVSRNFFFKDDRIRLSPFITATAYHDFAGDIDATLTMDPNSANPVVLPVKTERLKTYGELSFGANLLALTGKINGVDRLIIGSVRGDVQYGENIVGGSVTAQFRMQF